MSEKLVLIGGGGHCKSVLDTIKSLSIFDDIVITDVTLPRDTIIFGAKVVGDDAVLKELFRNGYRNAVIAIGGIESLKKRRTLISEIKKLGYHLPTIIDPHAIISKYAKLGEGVFVGKRAVVNSEAVVGNYSIINTGAIVEHNCFIGDNSHISVGANLCGTVVVGNNSFVGAGTVVRDGITIGDNVIIGAGSFVNKNISSGAIAYGVPSVEK